MTLLVVAFCDIYVRAEDTTSQERVVRRRMEIDAGLPAIVWQPIRSGLALMASGQSHRFEAKCHNSAPFFAIWSI